MLPLTTFCHQPFETIGRIVVRAAVLEGQLAISAVSIAGKPAGERDPANVLREPDPLDDPAVYAPLTNPGGALAAFRRAVALVVDDEVRAELEAVAIDSQVALSERHRVAHSVLRWRLPDGAYAGTMDLLSFHPRSRTWTPLFTEEVNNLEMRLTRLSLQVTWAGNRGHADWFLHRRDEARTSR